MSLTTAPVTPTSAAQTPGTISLNATGNETPGTWRHPRLDEIARRRRAALFTADNVRTIFTNLALLLATIVSLPSFLSSILVWLKGSLDSLPPASIAYSMWTVLSLRLFFIANITIALSPVLRQHFSREDEITDIPLTPAQRKLLGLNPTPSSSAPPSPASGYITPPRYSRSVSGSRSGTPLDSNNSRRAIAGTPPGSGSGKRSSFGSPFASPFGNGSPRERDGSPLLHMAIAGSPRSAGFGRENRRWSHGSNQSPLGLSRGPGDSLMGMGLGDSTNLFNQSTTIPGTPTPAANMNKREGGPSVTLNSKWLYEKGRNSLGGRGFY